jgi:hypothetical protein
MLDKEPNIRHAVKSRRSHYCSWKVDARRASRRGTKGGCKEIFKRRDETEIKSARSHLDSL